MIKKVDVVRRYQDRTLSEVIRSIKLLDLLCKDNLLILLHLVAIPFEKLCYLGINLIVLLSKLEVIEVSLVRGLVQEGVSHHSHRGTCPHNL